jgi:hypothetical protein
MKTRMAVGKCTCIYWMFLRYILLYNRVIEGEKMLKKIRDDHIPFLLCCISSHNSGDVRHWDYGALWSCSFSCLYQSSRAIEPICWEWTDSIIFCLNMITIFLYRAHFNSKYIDVSCCSFCLCNWSIWRSIFFAYIPRIFFFFHFLRKL